MEPQTKTNPVQDGTPTFRFLGLPAELRNSVYELALMTPIQWFTAPDFNHLKRAPHRNALLFVNRQINSEMLPLLYGQTLNFMDDRYLHRALSMMGPANRTLLKDVVLQTVNSASFLKKSAFLLRDAARSLQSLRLDWYGQFTQRQMRYQHGHYPRSRTFDHQYTATRIHLAMYGLFGAITEVRGIETALDTVILGDANYPTYSWHSQLISEQERTRLFNLYRNELKEKVLKRQKRDMARNLGLELKSLTLRDRVVEWHKE